MEMKTYTVRDPDGYERVIRGPAGASDAEVIAQAKKLFSLERSHDNIKRDQEGYNPTSGMSMLEKGVAGIGAEMSAIGRGARQLNERIGEAVSLDPGAREAHKANRKELERREQMARETDAPLNATGAGQVGRLIGGTVALAPVGGLGAAGRGASMLRRTLGGAGAGGGIGAIMPATSDKERLVNMGVGIGGGAAIPAVLGAAGRTANRAPRPLTARDRVLKELQDEGIGVTVEDKFTHPVARTVGRVGRDTLSGQIARHGPDARKAKQVTRAILRHIGEDADEATPEVMNRAKQRLGAEFGKVFSPNVRVAATPDFIQDLSKVMTNLPHDEAIANAVRTEVTKANALLGRRGGTSANQVKELIAHLERRIASARGDQKFSAAEAYDDIIDALEDATFRAAGPKARAALQTARLQWRNFRAIERAVDRDWQGGISPRKLAGTLQRSRFTRNAYQKAEPGTLERLARNLMEITDTFPNSGTAGRVLPVAEASTKLPWYVVGGNAAIQKAATAKLRPIKEPAMLKRALAPKGPDTASGVTNMALLVPLLQAFRADPEGTMEMLGFPAPRGQVGTRTPPGGITEEELVALVMGGGR